MPKGLQGFQKDNKLGLGKKPRLGMKTSEETKRKQSLAHLGKQKSLETRKKLSEYAKSIGRTPPSRKGKHWSKESRRKISEQRSGERSFFWKGDFIGNRGVHLWVEKWKGKPQRCEMCGTKENRVYNWANVDHKYRRVLEDYIRMCKPCHTNYDIKNKK